MITDPDTPASGAPASPDDPLRTPDPGAAERRADPSEARSFGEAAPVGGRAEAPRRPQADFGAPISLPDRDGTGSEEAGAPADPDPPAATGGDIPPLFAMADDAAEPAPPEPRVERPLTRRIRQGMPSYSEPDSEIAGVVGRAAERRDSTEDPAGIDGPERRGGALG